MKHSSIVGGSTAKRVIACPGSVALCQKMPPRPSNQYADQGTLLHSAMSAILETDTISLAGVLGTTYENETITQDLIDDKILPALAALEVIDPEQKMEFAVEQTVQFGKFLPNVFGSADLIGRLGDTAVVVDWKFGDGVAVSAEENEQLMFYAAAAMRTPETKWAFEGAEKITLIIVQPPEMKPWTTNPDRIARFEKILKRAVKAASQIDAPLKVGDHCRWCAAKPICPLMTGATDRALQTQIQGLDKVMIGKYLKNADLLEEWIKDLRALAMQIMESGEKVPDWKLVVKRRLRRWVDEKIALFALQQAGVDPYKPKEMISPAQAEKLLKPAKLPDDLAVSVSSGVTFAPESDPRPEV